MEKTTIILYIWTAAQN